MTLYNDDMTQTQTDVPIEVKALSGELYELRRVTERFTKAAAVYSIRGMLIDSHDEAVAAYDAAKTSLIKIADRIANLACPNDEAQRAIVRSAILYPLIQTGDTE